MLSLTRFLGYTSLDGQTVESKVVAQSALVFSPAHPETREDRAVMESIIANQIKEQERSQKIPLKSWDTLRTYGTFTQ